MSGQDDSERREKVLLEAAEWLSKAIDDRMSSAERLQFDTWLNESREHLEAYHRIERLWQGSGDLPEVQQRREHLLKRLTRRDIGKGIILIGTAALGARYLLDAPLADFRTGQGEKRTIHAEDGSSFQLAPLTRMSLTFTGSERSIQLFHGEAYFDVANSDKPFSVQAGNGSTTALGTSFSVRYREDLVRVVVNKHAVQVKAGNASMIVKEGEQLDYRHQLGPVRTADTAEALAWTNGRLIFDGKPLGEVVETLNLWHSGRIVIMSKALSARPVTLIINTDRIESVASQLESALPIKAVAIAAYLIFLFPA